MSTKKKKDGRSRNGGHQNSGRKELPPSDLRTLIGARVKKSRIDLLGMEKCQRIAEQAVEYVYEEQISINFKSKDDGKI